MIDSPSPGVLIDGAWRLGGGDQAATISPHTGDLVWSGATASAADVAAAVQTARTAAAAWSGASAATISSALYRFADRIDLEATELTDLVIREVGKTRNEAEEELRRAATIVRYYAGAPFRPEGRTIQSADGSTLVETRREPLGVVGLVLPWNFPIAIPIWKLAPAIAYGNAVILKPAPHATGCATAIANLCDHFPSGLISLLPGGAMPVREMLDLGVDGLSFTGSTEVGRKVAAHALERSTRFQGELGGKNASVVLNDADLRHAAFTITRAAFGYAGQKCTATSRVIVERDVRDAFVEHLLTHISALRLGNPESDETDVGPLISATAVERVDGFVQRAQGAGGRVLIGASRRLDLGASYYAPTVIETSDPESEMAQTEIFGPVLTMMIAKDAASAVSLANGTDYGLASAVFTSSLRGASLARRLNAGLIRVNAPTPGVDFNAPFAPDRASGIGPAELGDRAADFFTRDRTITVHVPA